MNNQGQFKYLISSDRDLLWGMVVDNVGQAKIENNYKIYPPEAGHPANYYFTPQNGRIPDTYQLVYISSGKGIYFTSSNSNESIQISTGDMLIIPPYTWHSYYPDKNTGWHEYWIGMHGPHLDIRFKNGFWGTNKLIYKVGVREDIIHLFNQAIDLAFSEKNTYQQTLAGLGNLILGMTIYYDCNQNFINDIVAQQIDQARSVMRENFLLGITPQEVAQQVNMSYSWFRKMFKEYKCISSSFYLRIEIAES